MGKFIFINDVEKVEVEVDNFKIESKLTAAYNRGVEAGREQILKEAIIRLEHDLNNII